MVRDWCEIRDIMCVRASAAFVITSDKSNLLIEFIGAGGSSGGSSILTTAQDMISSPSLSPDSSTAAASSARDNLRLTAGEIAGVLIGFLIGAGLSGFAFHVLSRRQDKAFPRVVPPESEPMIYGDLTLASEGVLGARLPHIAGTHSPPKSSSSPYPGVSTPLSASPCSQGVEETFAHDSFPCEPPALLLAPHTDTLSPGFPPGMPPLPIDPYPRIPPRNGILQAIFPCSHVSQEEDFPSGASPKPTSAFLSCSPSLSSNPYEAASFRLMPLTSDIIPVGLSCCENISLSHFSFDSSQSSDSTRSSAVAEQRRSAIIFSNFK